MRPNSKRPSLIYLSIFLARDSATKSIELGNTTRSHVEIKSPNSTQKMPNVPREGAQCGVT